jgi:hypothetical protein
MLRHASRSNMHVGRLLRGSHSKILKNKDTRKDQGLVELVKKNFKTHTYSGNHLALGEKLFNKRVNVMMHASGPICPSTTAKI